MLRWNLIGVRPQRHVGDVQQPHVLDIPRRQLQEPHEVLNGLSGAVSVGVDVVAIKGQIADGGSARPQAVVDLTHLHVCDGHGLQELKAVGPIRVVPLLGRQSLLQDLYRFPGLAEAQHVPRQRQPHLDVAVVGLVLRVVQFSHEAWPLVSAIILVVAVGERGAVVGEVANGLIGHRLGVGVADRCRGHGLARSAREHRHCDPHQTQRQPTHHRRSLTPPQDVPVSRSQPRT